ncbi:MAG: SPFH domain-containing protein [Pirellulales bacterium]
MPVRPHTIRRLITALLILMLVAANVAWFWTRVYVPEGYSLLLRYRGPVVRGMLGLARPQDQPGSYAEDGRAGVLEQMPGPGRHFYCPIWWQTQLVADTIIPPGKLGLVRSNLGQDLPSGEFLVDGELTGPQRATSRGTLRRVLGPGRYRINPYGFSVEVIETLSLPSGTQTKYSGWLPIPTGSVGVVTNMSARNPDAASGGLQDKVLPPGLYFLNPKEQMVDIVDIGYRESSLAVEKRMDGQQIILDESGEPIPLDGSGIKFPSNDGFTIYLDFTAVWGVMPDKAPQLVRTFGNIDQAELKVVLPQAESISRINGSRHSAVELLVGQSRQQFQEAMTEQFRQVLAEKNLSLMYGLVRHIYIPQEVRVPIQNGYIADETKLTREQEKITAETEGKLREAERIVELESERVRVDTERLKAAKLAEGQRESKEIAAETERQVALVERKIAELAAQKKVVVGQASATSQKLLEEAKSEKFDLAVRAFGSGEAFNLWQFADGLPETMDLRLVYAGQGTLWTDLKSVLPTLPITPPGSSSPPSGAPTSGAPASGAPINAAGVSGGGTVIPRTDLPSR